MDKNDIDGCRIVTDGHWVSELDVWIMLELTYQAMAKASVLHQQQEVGRGEFVNFVCGWDFDRSGLVEMIDKATAFNRAQPLQ